MQLTIKLFSTLCLLTLLVGCESTNVPTQPAKLGTPTTEAAMLAVAATPGPIVFNKHLAARWAVSLSGLVNLDHPKARAAGLEDRDEPIEVYVYSLTHPTQGTFIVDSGVAESLIKPEENTDLSTVVKLAMKTDALKVVKTSKALLAEQGHIDGVFLTHIHIDHVMGLKDLPGTTPVYIGPGDAAHTAFTNLFTQGSTDRLLVNQEVLNEWQFDDSGIIDVFADGSLFAIHLPGHTPGATAYLARTTEGPQLMIGDATHTAWGWKNGVEPGTFSDDIPLSAQSLARIKTIAAAIDNVAVHPGHQPLSSPHKE